MQSEPLRRNRDFVALWTGQTASALGTSISSLAYPLLVLTLTGSPALAGLVATVLAAAAFVLRIPASVLADRVDRKRLMLLCDAGRLVAVGSLGVAALVGRLSLAHIIVVALAEAAFGVLFAPAEAVAVRRVVAPSQVRHAVAVNQSRQQLASLVGPALGGALFGVSRALPFLADAVSYAISFVAVATIRTPLHRVGGPHDRSGRLRELTEGLRWLWRQRFLRFVVLWLAASGALFTSMGLVTLVLVRELGATPAQIGLTFTVTGAGGLVGALLAPRLLQQLSTGALLIGYAWVAAAATFLLLAARSPAAVGLIGAVAYMPVPAVTAAVMAQVSLDAPDHLQGRANSATIQLTTLFHPIGPALVGVVIAALGVGRTILVYGSLLVVLAVMVTLSRTVRGGPGASDNPG